VAAAGPFSLWGFKEPVKMAWVREGAQGTLEMDEAGSGTPWSRVQESFAKMRSPDEQLD
jgi:hypothetical protein